ncbi:MAG: hypothetical protein AAGA06_14260, partial [Pseudomonadota bacterium]
RKLQDKITQKRKTQQKESAELNRDVARYMMMGGKAPVEICRKFETKSSRPRGKERARGQHRDQDRGPVFEP